jgi:hypothetical protein
MTKVYRCRYGVKSVHLHQGRQVGVKVQAPYIGGAAPLHQTAPSSGAPDAKPQQAARRKRVDPGDSLAQLKRREQREVRLSREVGQACKRWLDARGIRWEPGDSRQPDA